MVLAKLLEGGGGGGGEGGGVEEPCDGLASHPGGNSNSASRLMLQIPG